jgi:hypothetical protein
MAALLSCPVSAVKTAARRHNPDVEIDPQELEQ